MINLKSAFSLFQRLHSRRPVALSYNVTHRCNLKCLMCNIYKTKIDELSLAELDPILRDLKTAGFEIIEITGGEPFMRSDLFEIFALLEQRGFRYTLNTNGILLDAHNCRKLGTFPGILQIAVSIDSLKPEVFARIRGRDKLDQVLAGLDTLLKADIGKPIKINLTVNRFNYHEVPAILEFCRKHGIYLSVFPVNLGSNFRHRGLADSLLPDKNERDQMALLFHRLENLRKRGEILWEHSSFYRGAVDYIHANWVGPCDAGGLFFDLHADGKIAVCNDLPPFGDLKTEKFLDCVQRLPGQRAMINHCYQNHPCYYTCTYAISAIARHKVSYLLENARMMGLTRLFKNYAGMLRK